MFRQGFKAARQSRSITMAGRISGLRTAKPGDAIRPDEGRWRVLLRLVSMTCGSVCPWLCLGLAAVPVFGAEEVARAATSPSGLRAGVAVVDISPTNFPVIVNAMFTERTATQTVDRLNVRALVLEEGGTRVALAVVDTCMMSRDLIDQAKAIAHRSTGIPVDRMLVSATHTHSAPSAMGCLGSRIDPRYAAYLPGRIAEAILAADGRRAPAEVGWGVVDDWRHTFNRRWIRRP
ncbi:MAG: hypothetical protein JNL97_10235, partial [Verrucomicrobiales bacterium]|nr:hypothetical protein [Verrucomicrobiales bacterium]